MNNEFNCRIRAVAFGLVLLLVITVGACVEAASNGENETSVSWRNMEGGVVSVAIATLLAFVSKKASSIKLVLMTSMLIVLPLASARTCPSGWGSAGGDLCVPCPVDYYASASTGKCERCSAGSYANEESVECTVVEDERIAGWPKRVTMQKLMSPNPLHNTLFGQRVALFRDWAFVQSGPPQGNVYVFKKQGDSWIGYGKLAETATTSTDYGYSMDISYPFAIVGDPDQTVNGKTFAGAAYIYKYNETTSVWESMVRISATGMPGHATPLANDQFGMTVAISGDLALAGCPNFPDDVYAGSVAYIIRDHDTWTIAAATKGQQARTRFGTSLSFSGTMAAIGTKERINGVTDHGSVYINEYTSSRVSPRQKLVPNIGGGMGWDVSLTGDTLLVGGYNSTEEIAWSYRQSDSGQWQQQQNVIMDDSTPGTLSYFGWTAEATGHMAIIGAHHDDNYTNCASGQHCGSFYVYGRRSSASTWKLIDQVFDPTPNNDGRFGRDVAISDNGWVLVGNLHDDPHNNGTRYGAAYVYKYACPAGQFLISALCAKCPGGTYNAVPGSVGPSTCISCPNVGQYAAPGSTSCSMCDLGTYVAPNKSKCNPCPPGTASGTTGASSLALCLPCPPGSYAPSSGSPTCTSCPLGMKCDTSNMISPIPCPIGTFTTSNGSTACIACAFPGQCIGGGKCAANHDGTLCGGCVTRYFMKGYLCEACPTVPTLLIVASVIAAVLIIIFIAARIPPKWLIILRLLSGFIQGYTLSLAVSTPWPEFVKWLRRVLSLFYFDVELAAPECIFENYNWYYRYWTVIIAASCVPILLLMTVLVISAVRKTLIVTKSKWPTYLALTKLQVRLSRTIFTVFTLAFVPVTKMAATAFVCIKSAYVLRDDTSVSCSTPQHIGIQVISAFTLLIFSLLGPLFLAISTLYDVYLRDNKGVNKQSIFLTDRLLTSFRHRKYLQCVGWCFFYPVYIVGCFWLIPLIRYGSQQSESNKRNGYRHMDRRQVLGVAYEGYHPQYSYFEAVILARKAIFAVITVSAASSVAQSIVLVCASVLYIVIVLLLRPFVPLPVQAKQNQRLAVNMLNWMEVVWASCVLLTNIITLIIAAVGSNLALEILAAIIVGITGVVGVLVIAFPILMKNEQVKQEADTKLNTGLCTTLNLDVFLPNSAKKNRPTLPANDERTLLGWGDGLWLQSLEKLRKETLEETDQTVIDKIELGGACTVWIDRLIGRLEARVALMGVFHPTLSAKRKSTRILHVPDRSDSIALEDLKFRHQRHSVVGRIGTSSIKVDLAVESAPPLPPKPTPKPSKYEATFAYVPEEDQEGYIELSVGDMIDVTKKDGEWWEGTVVVSGVSGWFPGSYVKESGGVQL